MPDRPLYLGSLRVAVKAPASVVAAVESWFEFRKLRSITAHTYARDKSLKVAAGAPLLLVQARALLSTIEARNHD
jgi:hypothetical protein